MLKKITTLALSAIFAISLSVPQVTAGKNRNRDAAIAAAIGLGLLAAIAASDQNKRGNRRKPSRQNFGGGGNAVNTCMRHARRLVRQAGGYQVKLNTVRKINRKPNGRTVVVFVATGFYDYGQKRSRARCVVKNNRVVKFNFS